jgi:hypothetical protein
MKKHFVLVVLVAVAIFGASGMAQAGLNDGLVAYYPFNGDANDESGNGHNGTVYGAKLAADKFGNENSAYSFDGINDHIELGTWFNYSNFSLSLWIRSEKSQNNKAIIDNNHNSNFSWAIHQYDYEVWFNGPSNDNPHYVNADIALNEWQHFVFIKNSNNLKIYVNGLFIDVLSKKNDITYNGNENLGLARWWGTTNWGTTNMERFWAGLIDDLRIYNRVLSETEINELYREGDAPISRPPAIKKIVWPCDCEAHAIAKCTTKLFFNKKCRKKAIEHCLHARSSAEQIYKDSCEPSSYFYSKDSCKKAKFIVNDIAEQTCKEMNVGVSFK